MDLQSEPFNYSKIPSWVLTEKYPVSFDEKQSCVGFPAHESIPLFLWEMLSFGWNLFSKTEFQKVKQLLKIPLSYSCNTMNPWDPEINMNTSLIDILECIDWLERVEFWSIMGVEWQPWVINHFWVLSNWMVAYI